MGTIRHPLAETRSNGLPDITPPAPIRVPYSNGPPNIIPPTPLRVPRSNAPPDVTPPAPLRVPCVPSENLTFSDVPELVDPQAFRPSKSRPWHKKSIISCMHKLFRRPPPSPNPTANEDDDQQNQPLLPSVCTRLGSEDISIVGDHPARCGAFADVWDGSLAGSRVVIKSYRTYSTQARTVRVHRYLQAFSFTDLPSATETL